MRYHELRRRRLAIASGIVDAAHKTHIGERLKRSGMRWGLEGGHAILTFRSLVNSNRFDAARDWLVETRGPQVRPTTTGNAAIMPWRHSKTHGVAIRDSHPTLIQARAALQQNRKFFILDSCFRNSQLTWPPHILAKGAIKVREYTDVQRHLSAEISENR